MRSEMNDCDDGVEVKAAAKKRKTAKEPKDNYFDIIVSRDWLLFLLLNLTSLR
jgi:hypothetical protein